jgi:hypothetical protein
METDEKTVPPGRSSKSQNEVRRVKKRRLVIREQGRAHSEERVPEGKRTLLEELQGILTPGYKL